MKISIYTTLRLIAMTLISFMNWIGATIAIIWLVSIGEWKAIGVGILIAIFSKYIIYLALIPGWIFSVPSAKFHERGRYVLAKAFGIISVLYTVFIMIIWSYTLFKLFDSLADDTSRIPMMITSYSLVIFPWAELVKEKEILSDNFLPWNTHYTFLCLGYIMVIILTLFFGVQLITAYFFLCLVMIFSFSVHLIYLLLFQS